MGFTIVSDLNDHDSIGPVQGLPCGGKHLFTQMGAITGLQLAATIGGIGIAAMGTAVAVPAIAVAATGAAFGAVIGDEIDYHLNN